MKKKMLLLAAATSVLSGCGSVDRLRNVGRPPAMTPMEEFVVPAFERSIATEGPSDRRVGSAAPSLPAPAPSASLFRAGAGTLFHDQRASRVGDILTIEINIADKANFSNTTARSRSGSENVGIGALLGLESIIPGSPGSAVDASSKSQSGGQGSTTRSETINMTMAAIVTDVLPNGNLVIRGRQEMRVNYDLRELIVTGIVRPQDVGRTNTIAHSQIAEARISYGGRGHRQQRVGGDGLAKRNAVNPDSDDEADQHVDGSDQQAGNRIAFHELRSTVHRAEKGAFGFELLAP